jgi:hypothetical protein
MWRAGWKGVCLDDQSLTSSYAAHTTKTTWRQWSLVFGLEDRSALVRDVERKELVQTKRTHARTRAMQDLRTRSQKWAGDNVQEVQCTGGIAYKQAYLAFFPLHHITHCHTVHHTAGCDSKEAEPHPHQLAGKVCRIWI